MYRIEAFGIGLDRRAIGELSNRFGCCEATEKTLRMGTIMWIASAKCGKCGRCIVRGNEMKGLAVPPIDVSPFGMADASSIFHHNRKHWL